MPLRSFRSPAFAPGFLVPGGGAMLAYRIARAHLDAGRACITFPMSGGVGIIGLQSWQSRLFTENDDPRVRVNFLIWATVQARRAALDGVEM